MKQCSHGHIYDEMRYADCPYCDNSGMSATMPLNTPASFGGASPDFPKTAPLTDNAVSADSPVPKSNKGNKEMSATVALNSTDSGIRPVVGWLVVTEGDKKGTSFNVYPEKNYIGRGIQFDVNLNFDKAVSKEGDIVIAYDDKHSTFFIAPGSGKNNVYVNAAILLQPIQLKEYDIIEVGETKLVFRSLCNAEFNY